MICQQHIATLLAPFATLLCSLCWDDSKYTVEHHFWWSKYEACASITQQSPHSLASATQAQVLPKLFIQFHPYSCFSSNLNYFKSVKLNFILQNQTLTICQKSFMTSWDPNILVTEKTLQVQVQNKPPNLIPNKYNIKKPNREN